MGEGETKRIERSGGGDRQVGIAPAAAGVLLASFLSAGGASQLVGSSTNASLVKLEVQLEAMREDQKRATDALQAVVMRLDGRDADLDARLRAAELRLERLDPRPR